MKNKINNNFDNLNSFVDNIKILTYKETIHQTIEFFSEKMNNINNSQHIQFESADKLNYNFKKYKNYLY